MTGSSEAASVPDSSIYATSISTPNEQRSHPALHLTRNAFSARAVRWCFAPLSALKIGTRLYLLAGLALSVVVVLSAAALHFVSRSGEEARDIRALVQVELSAVGELELLLERHRRIVESAPVELDRKRIASLILRARDVIEGMKTNAPMGGTPKADPILQVIPALASQGERALDLAMEFAQGEAIDQVAIYAATARALQARILDYKVDQLARIDRDVGRLIASGTVLTWWVAVGSLIALVLIGPVSFIVTRQIVKRLGRIVISVRALALNDTTVHVSGTRHPDELGDIARALEIFKSNANELLVQQREIGTMNRRFKFALENMSRGLSMFDSERRLIVCNARYGELYRLPDSVLVAGTPFEDIIAARIAVGTGRVGEEVGVARLAWPCDEEKASTSDVLSLTHELVDGRIIQIAYQPIDGGGWVALHQDATTKQQQAAIVERLARIDAVTGIANRHAFTERLDQAFSALQSAPSFAVHWIDLDRFKEVNDTFGHPIGDALLQQVARRLTNVVRSQDFVARIGGDEFAVIQEGVTSRSAAAALAGRIIEVVSASYELGGCLMDIGASAGVVVAPFDGASSLELQRNADIALYRAKAEGRRRHIAFDPIFVEEIKKRRILEQDVLAALRQGDFTLHYQPVIDVAGERVRVCEALMRWSHPAFGPVSPAVFIPIAEAMGIMGKLGAFAVAQACRDALAWPSHIKVAVNVSAVQLAQSDFYDVVVKVLEDLSFPPERLELEITETVLMGDDGVTMETLTALRGLGITFALDDFGTGYASLNYLRRFPFDKIKIDQTFIRDSTNEVECIAIMRAITTLAQSLGMETVAEGVETPDHVARVRAAGCDGLQGYLIGRPVSQEQLLAALALGAYHVPGDPGVTAVNPIGTPSHSCIAAE